MLLEQTSRTADLAAHGRRSAASPVDAGVAAPLKPVEILIVNYDPAEAGLAERLLRDDRGRSSVYRTRDEVQALAFLRRDGAYRAAPRPDLILIDLSLRRAGGELLTEIKFDPELRDIPVIAMIEPGQGDAQSTTALADATIGKPLDADEFLAALRSFSTAQGEPAGDAAELADLAYQLRTHLNPIVAFSEIMQSEMRGPLSSDYREYARGIHLSALALSRIVFDILDRSKGRFPAPPGRTSELYPGQRDAAATQPPRANPWLIRRARNP